MFLKSRLIRFKFQKPCRRSLSFLERFCKKDRSAVNDSDKGGPSVNVELNNSFRLYNLEKEPNSSICLTKKLAIKLYTQMQTVRKVENACANLYKEKIIRGFCHLYTGQEACCVGIKSAMRSEDSIITSYRSHGWTWLMGVPVYGIIAELCQKQTGCSRGKGGSMHTYAPNFYGGNGIVGAQTPLGAGVAFAHVYRCDGGVNFTCYGDGAANQGQLHETFNMSCLWKLPIVFVCENNKYGMGTSVHRSSCNTNYYTRGDYIPGLWVDGNNVLAVRSAAEFVINHVRSSGPIVLELETYRYQGHSMSDPGTSYRKREEVKMMRDKHDPITTFKDLCLKEKLISEEEFKKIDETIKNEINDALRQMRQDKDTVIDELANDVYALNLEGNIRNVLRRDLKHGRIGTRLVPTGTIKATPKTEIKELTKIEAKTEMKPLIEKNKEDAKASETEVNIENGLASHMPMGVKNSKPVSPVSNSKSKTAVEDNKPKDLSKKE